MINNEQLVKIKYNAKIASHYKNLGYTFKPGDIIDVPVKHLTEGSHVKIEVACDCCGHIFERSYYSHLIYHKEHGIDLCRECRKQERYNTNLEKYGFKIPSQNKEIKSKIQKTNLDRYGYPCSLQGDSVIEKTRNTIMNKYGCLNVSNNKIIREKACNTMLKKYGVKYSMQSPELKEKALKSYSNHGTGKASRQQIKIYDMLKDKYECILNYPEHPYMLDCYINVDGTQIDIEYDGWYWHKDRTNEDKKRDIALKNKGYKILRIKSRMQLPTYLQLAENIDHLINSEDYYTEIILDDWNNTHIS